jgi:CubicO group peptidase (beta-lactamase class C family)
MGSGYDIARAVEELIRSGHAPADVWKMTPRQMAAWLQLAMRRKFAEQAQLLTLMRAARSDDKHFQTFLRKLQEESQ